MPNYAYHIDTVIGWALPNALRKPRLYALVRALVAPAKYLHNQLIGFRTGALFNINTNGQVCYLKSALNRKFDPALRRIYIEDGVINPIIYIFNEVENSPIYLPEFMSSSDADFVVFVPIALQSQDTQIKALVNQFRLVSKQFSITYFV